MKHCNKSIGDMDPLLSTCDGVFGRVYIYPLKKDGSAVSPFFNSQEGGMVRKSIWIHGYYLGFYRGGGERRAIGLGKEEK